MILSLHRFSKNWKYWNKNSARHFGGRRRWMNDLCGAWCSREAHVSPVSHCVMNNAWTSEEWSTYNTDYAHYQRSISFPKCISCNWLPPSCLKLMRLGYWIRVCVCVWVYERRSRVGFGDCGRHERASIEHIVILFFNRCEYLFVCVCAVCVLCAWGNRLRYSNFVSFLFDVTIAWWNT